MKCVVCESMNLTPEKVITPIIPERRWREPDYFDPEGKFHSHSLLVRGKYKCCSNGHVIEESIAYIPCISCGMQWINGKRGHASISVVK